MRRYWPEPQVEQDTAELAGNRRKLVDEFNAIVGIPGTEALALQNDFVAGTVTYDEAVSFVRYAQYMIDAASRYTQ